MLKVRRELDRDSPSSGVAESQHRFWSGVIWDAAKAGCKRDGVLENEISILSQMIWIQTSQLKQARPLRTDISPKYSLGWQQAFHWLQQL